MGLKSNTRIIVEPTVTSPTSVLKDIKKFDVSIWCMNPTLLKVYSKLLSTSNNWNEYRNKKR